MNEATHIQDPHNRQIAYEPMLAACTGLKVLNLYSGIGGNRKLWENVEVTSVEYNEEIAAIYKDYYPNDNLIIGDAHEYLLKHYKEFDFIWTSPPCQTHSDIRRMGVAIGQNEAVFPDMKLWQEIVFLKHHFKGKWIVENVKPYYEPFVQPSIQLDRHFIWCNFKILSMNFEKDNQIKNINSKTEHYGFDLTKYKMKHRKDQVLRNCVNPDLGLYILEQALGVIRQSKFNQLSLFGSM
jgi:DNA (cytosine-5)-methyltransferase 1